MFIHTVHTFSNLKKRCGKSVPVIALHFIQKNYYRSHHFFITFIEVIKPIIFSTFLRICLHTALTSLLKPSLAKTASEKEQINIWKHTHIKRNKDYNDVKVWINISCCFNPLLGHNKPSSWSVRRYDGEKRELKAIKNGWERLRQNASLFMNISKRNESC